MTERLPDDAIGIARAASLLRTGHLVAFATETVYGLGADATDPEAVAAIYAAKGRPDFNPLICHGADADTVFAHVHANDGARALAAAFWPGPLTLVLPRKPDSPIADRVTAGLPSLAVRVPAHPVARRLLEACGRLIAAPSANRSGQLSPTSADHVALSLSGRIAAILDSGPCPVGVESTIIDLAGALPILLRPGGIEREALERVAGPIGCARADAAIAAPGMMASHYAPRLPLRLNARAPDAGEAWLGFGPALVGARLTISLSPVSLHI